jgi:CDP-diacylglycerol--glycerol-3-phosphate 3-phosphatidyltransferase
MSNILQRLIDSFWNKTLFRIIPESITPNFFTFLRFLLIPAVLYFLVVQQFGLSLFIFAVAALADSIDGALARVRNQISDYGTMLDPMADKLLISLLSLFLLFFYPYITLLLIVIALDILIGVESLIFMMVTGTDKVPSSNWTGKSKMVFQVFGLIIIMCFLINGSEYLLGASIIFLELAVLTGIVSLVSYSIRAWKLARKLIK